MGVICEDFYVTSGATKLVIVVDSLPFVIKIPFDGYTFWDEYSEEYIFSEFTEANENFYNDYCYDELEKIEHIIAYGYGCLVPQTECIGIFNGHYIYLQEKVQPMCECRKVNASEESLKKAEKDTTAFCSNWIAKVFDFYGEEFWNQFITWVEETDLDIFSDCHTGNYGISMDGRPMMFDISGFRDR